MIRRAVIGAVLALASAALAIQAAALKYEHGQLLRLDPRDESVWAGATHIEVSRQAKQFRRIVIRDFSLSAAGTLAVSASASFNAGVNTNVVLLFNARLPAEPPKVLTTGDVFCEHLAWGQSRLWCLGPDFRRMVASQPYAVLWQIGLDGDLKPVLHRDQFALNAAPPWKTAALGDAQLMVNGETAWIWHPGAGSVIRLASQPNEPARFGVSGSVAGRSRISMAVWGERIAALLPVRTEGEETFTTPYALFALDPSQHQWVRISPTLLPRGAQLLAVEDGKAVVWDRRGKGQLLRKEIEYPSR
ncbi:MAG TPA: hypothetical protein PLZ95_02070 [Bryobacteraceae bacterium]|nr:hypothetical protein [Bryobacteraceae bacterium]